MDGENVHALTVAENSRIAAGFSGKNRQSANKSEPAASDAESPGYKPRLQVVWQGLSLQARLLAGSS